MQAQPHTLRKWASVRHLGTWAIWGVQWKMLWTSPDQSRFIKMATVASQCSTARLWLTNSRHRHLTNSQRCLFWGTCTGLKSGTPDQPSCSCHWLEARRRSLILTLASVNPKDSDWPGSVILIQDRCRLAWGMTDLCKITPEIPGVLPRSPSSTAHQRQALKRPLLLYAS